MRISKLGVTFLAGAFLSESATAQNSAVIERIKMINEAAPVPAAAEIDEALRAAADAAANKLGTCSPKSVEIESIASATGTAAVLNGIIAGKLKNGWSAYVHHLGCPDHDLYRYTLLQLADGSLRAVQMNSGRSYANLSIQLDGFRIAFGAAFIAVKKVDPACDGQVTAAGATRIESESKDLGPELYGVRYTGSWSEIWPFKLCDRTAEVKITFQADGDGGAYVNAKDIDVVLSPPVRP